MSKRRTPLLLALAVAVVALGLALAWQACRARRPAVDPTAVGPAAAAPAATVTRAKRAPPRDTPAPERLYATPAPEAVAPDVEGEPATAKVTALLEEARAHVRAAAAKCPIEPTADRRARLEVTYGIVVESNTVRLVNVESHGGNLEEGPLRTCFIEHIVVATWRTTVTEHDLPVTLEDSLTVAEIEDAKRR